MAGWDTMKESLGDAQELVDRTGTTKEDLFDAARFYIADQWPEGDDQNVQHLIEAIYAMEQLDVLERYIEAAAATKESDHG